MNVNDLTQGPISGHLIRMAMPIGIGMLFQTLYYLVDLYFVGRISPEALAGVSAAANLQFLMLALTQVLGVGGMALIAQATGRKDFGAANAVFEQTAIIAAILTLLVTLGAAFGAGLYMAQFAPDAATAGQGIAYLHGAGPGLALQFPLVAMGAAMRGTGVAKPAMLSQIVSVLLNLLLAPMLIGGWGTGHPLGAFGAGLATSISVLVGVILLGVLFIRIESILSLQWRRIRFSAAICRRILAIGVPPGAEMLLMFFYFAFIIWILRDFGSGAQAGFGLGSRLMQALFLPAVAIGFGASPVAGQNVGAGFRDRVLRTFRDAAIAVVVIMVAMSAVCWLAATVLVNGFSTDPQARAVAVQFLGIAAFNFPASGLIFLSSGMFQALGNTRPALLSSGSRILSFVLPGYWLSTRPEFELSQLWLLSAASVALQAGLSLLLLWRAFRHLRLEPTAEPAVAPPV